MSEKKIENIENESGSQGEKKESTSVNEKSQVSTPGGESDVALQVPQKEMTSAEIKNQESIKKRIKALKVLYEEYVENDSKHYEEILQLERKYDELSKKLLEKRSKILNGEYEPTEEESNYQSDEEDPKGVIVNQEKKIEYIKCEDDVKGIPKFWLTVLKNTPKVKNYIKVDDEPILSHLEDIKVKLHESPLGFTLEFHFSENEYFTNKILTKYYEISTVPYKGHLASIEGPSVVDCKGCNIDWKKGKDASITSSFFKIFNPIISKSVSNPSTEPEKAEELKEALKQILIRRDFVLSSYIKSFSVPSAVLYYTGEAHNLNIDDDEDEKDKNICDVCMTSKQQEASRCNVM